MVIKDRRTGKILKDVEFRTFQRRVRMMLLKNTHPDLVLVGQETPETSAVKVVTKKDMEPKAEEPKAEEPKAEEPKAEEPKAEEPKAKPAKSSTPRKGKAKASAKKVEKKEDSE